MATSLDWEFQSIPIDFQVFKALTALLDSERDTYNNVLRRLLQLGIAATSLSESSSRGGAWIVDGLQFPVGTEFRARYKGTVHTGRVENGALVVGGQRFSSPSPAAIAITGNSVNGWKFWSCRRPGQTGWVVIDRLRRS